MRVLALSREQRAGQSWTVARWLRYWLSTRRSIRPTTLRVYTHHVEDYLIPTLGDLRLAALDSHHLNVVFTRYLMSPERPAVVRGMPARYPTSEGLQKDRHRGLGEPFTWWSGSLRTCLHTSGPCQVSCKTGGSRRCRTTS